MSGYRLAVISYLAYPDRVDAIYGAAPGLAGRPYEEQMLAIREHPATPVLPFRRDFAALGVEVAEFFPDVGQLNHAWARDRGLDTGWHGPAVQWRTAVLLGQLAEFKPDAVYVHGLLGLPDDFFAEVKDAVPSIRVMSGFEGLIVRRPLLRDLDLLFVCVPPFADDARALGMEADVLYHSFDTAILGRPEFKEPVQDPIDFSFVGSSGWGGENIHCTRYWALFELLTRTPLEAWLNEPWLLPASRRLPPRTEVELEERLRCILADAAPDEVARLARREAEAMTDLPPLPLARLFSERCHPALYGIDMLLALRRSRVTFNMHTTLAAGAVGNYRLFEATGAGACLLTEYGTNLGELFVPDKEVVVYRSVEEAVEKALWLLDHEGDRACIAAAGQARTLSCHTFARRCARIDDAIRRLL